jgi:DNA-binding ferritin-like protein
MHVTTFLALQAQLKIMHWQTKSYAEHKALGKLYDTLDGLMDTFVEVHAGKYGNTLSKSKFEFSALNYKDTAPMSVIDTAISYMSKDLPLILKEGDSDLLNIRDEMVAALNQTKYLLRLQ